MPPEVTWIAVADGVGVGGLDRLGQRGRVTGQDRADADAAPVVQRDQPHVLPRVAERQICGLPRRAHGPGMNAPSSEVRHSARLPPPVPSAKSRRSLIGLDDSRDLMSRRAKAASLDVYLELALHRGPVARQSASQARIRRRSRTCRAIVLNPSTTPMATRLVTTAVTHTSPTITR